MHLNTGYKTYLFTFKKDGVRIVCPIIERDFKGYKDIAKPFGFSGFVGTSKHSKFSTHWKEFSRKQGYITGYPGLCSVFDFSDLFDPLEVFQNTNVFILDLQPPVNRILQKMSAGRRRQFNNWDEVISNFIYDRSELKNFFHDEYDNFLDRIGASSHYYLSSETISYLFTLENVVVVGAKQNGRIVSAYFFGITPYMATCIYVLSLPEGRHYSAPLIWFAAKELKNHCIPFLNLGGASGGLAEFKRRFGTQKKPLLSLKQVYRPKIYKEHCKKVNADPNDVNGFFPPYRK
jgi:hypothetical protein